MHNHTTNVIKGKGNFIKSILKMAQVKGLKVRKNILNAGWSIELPNHSCYSAMSNAELVSYVRGY